MIERIIEFSANNKFLVFLTVAFLAIWGIYSIKSTPLDAIPDLSDVLVIVHTEWPGQSPDIVEDQITYPIVSSMLAAPKVKAVRGQSYLGISFVYVIFEDGTDLYWARSRVMEYMSTVSAKLPSGVSPTIGPDATGVGWVYQYALVDTSGKHDLHELRSFQDWYLKYWLESVPGVAEVASIGGHVKEYQVDVDPNALAARNIPISKVVAAIRRSNNDVGGRTLEFAGTEFMIRGRGYIQSIDDIEKISLAVNSEGTPILIRDVAHVHLGPGMRRGIAELNGEGEVVGGIVVMRYGENALRVIERVKEKIEEIRPGLPQGVKLVTTYDRSELIIRAVDTLKDTLIHESIIVALICIIFLFHFRSAFVIILTLPVAILMAFIAMYYMRLTSNVMSLGGIAVAIGAMVDASIVLVENAHKRLEKWYREGEIGNRSQVIIDATKEVGKPIFFSLLVITVSFMPVFMLEAQEGRLFKPLAFTKTYAMLFSSLLAITFTPALMMLLLRGRVTPEARNPISRFLIWRYSPVARWVLNRKWIVIAFALVCMIATIPAFSRLGSEFMPPLNEGSILYMPTTPPGISITEAEKLLQVQDKLFMTFPEVETVFGKIGRANTPTDPAPLSMVETTITLKPKSEWREGMTWDGLISEMDKTLSLPGVTNGWYMPINARTFMLTTGIKSPVGIKVFGPDLEVIQSIGENVEGILTMVDGTRSVFAQRVTGGYFLDIDVDRDQIARYGLHVADVQDVIMSAIGGMRITQTIENQERYAVNVRYPRELRDDVDALKRILVPTHMGAQIPLGELADISFSTGPPMLTDEDAQLVGYVFVDVTDIDLGTYVENAREAVSAELDIPPGYRLEWSGQYEYMLRVRDKMRTVLPLTLGLIFVLLYLNFRSVTETLIVLLSVPFALVGSIWLLLALDYNLSVAVWVGIIAIAGVAAETGVIMIVYLDEAYDRWKREGRLKTVRDLYSAVMEGAVQRVRPKMMTVATTTLALLPIMWKTGSGADVMKRIAAPMIGGLVTSTILTLVVIPAVYAAWKQRQMR